MGHRVRSHLQILRNLRFRTSSSASRRTPHPRIQPPRLLPPLTEMSRRVWLVLTVAVFAIPIGPLLLALGMLHYLFYRMLGPKEHHLPRIVFVWLLCIA